MAMDAIKKRQAKYRRKRIEAKALAAKRAGDAALKAVGDLVAEWHGKAAGEKVRGVLANASVKDLDRIIAKMRVMRTQRQSEETNSSPASKDELDAAVASLSGAGGSKEVDAAIASLT